MKINRFEIMKAISLWQPWAWAMAEGIKRIETRSWPISYRGDLVICSAKRKPSLKEFGGSKSEYSKMLDLRKLKTPVEVFGMQGLFYLPDGTSYMIKSQL
jgi:hypothetical protein